MDSSYGSLLGHDDSEDGDDFGHEAHEEGDVGVGDLVAPKIKLVHDISS